MVEESFDKQDFLSLHQEYLDSRTGMALVRAKRRHAIFQVSTSEQKMVIGERTMDVSVIV